MVTPELNRFYLQNPMITTVKLNALGKVMQLYTEGVSPEQDFVWTDRLAHIALKLPQPATIQNIYFPKWSQIEIREAAENILALKSNTIVGRTVPITLGHIVGREAMSRDKSYLASFELRPEMCGQVLADAVVRMFLGCYQSSTHKDYLEMLLIKREV